MVYPQRPGRSGRKAGKIMRHVTVDTKILGAIGYPIGATRSPLLMNFWAEELGDDFVYFPLSIEMPQFDEAVRGLRALGAGGFNVTMPYKQRIMAHLDRITEEAELLESVNTVQILDHRLIGHNTDGFGFEQALLRGGAELRDRRALLIGAGAISGPACCALMKNGVSAIHIANRTPEKAERRAAWVNRHRPGLCTAGCLGRRELSEQMERHDLIINITPVGLAVHPCKEHAFDPDVLGPGKTVFDVLYVPLKTPLLRAAEERGCRTINGLQMFLGQARRAYELWAGHPVPEELMGRTEELILRDVAAAAAG